MAKNKIERDGLYPFPAWHINPQEAEVKILPLDPDAVLLLQAALDQNRHILNQYEMILKQTAMIVEAMTVLLVPPREYVAISGTSPEMNAANLASFLGSPEGAAEK